MQAHPGGLGLGLVVAEDDRDLDLAGAQQLERVERMRVGQADLQPGMPGRQRRQRRRHERSVRRGEGGEAHAAGVQSDVGGELRAGGIDAADDLGGAVGQQLPGRGEPDPAADPLQQLRAGLGLEPGEVMRDRRLGVVQLLRRRGDRSMARDGVDDAQPVDVQHASTLSMSQHESWHWTYEPVARKLQGMTATQIRPASRLSPLVAGIRTAVDSHADWAETAQLVADQLRRHLPTPRRADRRAAARLTRRLRRPHAARRARRLVLDRRPGLAARARSPGSTTTSPGACSASSRASSTRSSSTPT